MTASPASVPSAASVSLPQMQVLVARAGLVLNPGQMADLVLVWRQLAGLIASIPRDRPFADDQAFVFRLPPPEAAAPAPSPRSAARAAAPAPSKTAKPKPATARPAGVKPAPAKRKAAAKPKAAPRRAPAAKPRPAPAPGRKAPRPKR